MRIFITLLLLGTFGKVSAQALPSDSWINYNNRYLKIPVVKEGVYRISPATLNNAGVPAGTPGSAFRLFVKGAEVPLRTTTAGTLGSSDYLEFAGFANDGAADAGLYTGGAAVQTDPGHSLFTDTAAYFLTWEATPASVMRFQNATSNAPAGATTESKCQVITRQSFSGYFAQGASHSDEYRFPSSQFEEGEGFVNALTPPGGGFNTSLPTPGALSGQGAAVFTAGVVGYSLDYIQGNSSVPAPSHPIKIYANGNLVVDTTYGSQQYRRFSRSLSGGVSAGNTPLVFQSANSGAPNYDTWGISFVQLEYWRNTDFSGVQTARFKVAPSAAGRLLSLGGFSVAGGSPVLYDLTHKKYYQAQTAGTSQFYIDAANDETEFMVTTGATVIPASISKNIQFTDYGQPANGGDYVIISHPALNSTGAVDAYKEYRTSAAGGSYKSVLAYSPDLYDQFGWGIAQHPMAIKSFLNKLQQSGSQKPKQVFIIGHGVNYSAVVPGVSVVQTGALVPTFGNPGFRPATASRYWYCHWPFFGSYTCRGKRVPHKSKSL